MLMRFRKAEDGNYAVILTIAMIPIMAGVAGIVDFVGTSNDASVLQSSLDTAALAIATQYDFRDDETRTAGVRSRVF